MSNQRSLYCSSPDSTNNQAVFVDKQISLCLRRGVSCSYEWLTRAVQQVLTVTERDFRVVIGHQCCRVETAQHQTRDGLINQQTPMLRDVGIWLPPDICPLREFLERASIKSGSGPGRAGQFLLIVSQFWLWHTNRMASQRLPVPDVWRNRLQGPARVPGSESKHPMPWVSWMKRWNSRAKARAQARVCFSSWKGLSLFRLTSKAVCLAGPESFSWKHNIPISRAGRAGGHIAYWQ